METPPGKEIVNVSVPVAVPLQGSLVLLIALILIGNTPAALVVPEISPLVVSTVKPPGRPIASKLVGLLLAVI